jgi:hypothetical protein
MNTGGIRDSNTPLFALGTVYATPGALAMLSEQGVEASVLILRHHNGDWSEMTNEDRHANQIALRQGARIFSAYAVGPQTKLWVITEADRSATTLLLPSEY